jgi:hypothetical protein
MQTNLTSSILPETTYQDLILPIVHKTCLGRLHWIHKAGDLVRCLELENALFDYSFVIDRRLRLIRLEKASGRVLASWDLTSWEAPESKFWQIIDKVPRTRTLTSFLALTQNVVHNL